MRRQPCRAHLRCRQRASWLAPSQRVLLAAMLATLLVGCDGPGVVSPGAPRFGQVGGSVALDLVGSWRRAVFFVDDFGIARSTETTWQFGADGAVARVQVARNLTFGLADVFVSAGRYRIENTRLLIDVVTPSATQLSYEIRRTGNELLLAGETYLRVER